MLILKLNIDPAGPALELNFKIFKPAGQKTAIPVVGLSQNVIPILGVNDYVEYQAQDGLNNSVALSEELLETYLHTPTRFGKHHSRKIQCIVIIFALLF